MNVGAVLGGDAHAGKYCLDVNDKFGQLLVKVAVSGGNGLCWSQLGVHGNITSAILGVLDLVGRGGLRE